MVIFAGFRIGQRIYVRRYPDAVTAEALPYYASEVDDGPEAFNWGDRTAESVQLAYAILRSCVSEEIATQHYYQFNVEVTSKLPEAMWGMSEAFVAKWLEIRA